MYLDILESRWSWQYLRRICNVDCSYVCGECVYIVYTIIVIIIMLLPYIR